MFNQSVSKSPRSQKSIFGYPMDETSNSTPTNYLPSDFSTPIKRDIFATPTKHRLLNSTPRYSLSPVATPPRTNRRDHNRSNYFLNSTGPLLASTRYNVNVSTYEDAKSPGLASRIVQYNEEAEREREYKRPSTHQAKYGSPGLFPVVHLFKKKPPLLEQKPRRVTVRLSSPDHIRHHSQEYNRKLLEGIIKPGSPSFGGCSFVQPNGKSSPSTRSVLDALKEISRKRIHANEEFDLIDDSNKRIRTNQMNGDANKRLRDGSPLQDNSGKPPTKRLCLYDEYAASCSSMDFSFTKTETPVSKTKSVDSSTSTENSEGKHMKLINAETQTTVVEEIKNKQQLEQNKNIPTLSLADRLRKEEPLKSFEDDPLQRIRQHRLEILEGKTAEKITGSNVPTLDTVLNEPIPNQPEKTLVSILTHTKSSRKSDKHVHFSDPESTTKLLSMPDNQAVNTASSENSTVINTRLETPAPPSSPVNLQPTEPNAAVSATQASFSGTTTFPPLASKESVASTITSSPSSSLNAHISTSKQSTTFGNSQFSIPVVPQTLSATSPPKVGGFKFDLSKPSALTSSTNETGFALPIPSTLSASSVVSTSTVIISSATASIPSLAFSQSAKNTISSTSNSRFTFGHVADKPDANTLRKLFGTTVSATVATNTSSFSYGMNTAIGLGNKISNAAAMNFGTATTTSTSFGSPITTALASTFKFGSSNNEVATKQLFATPSTSTTIGSTPVTSTSSFGNSPATSLPTLGATVATTLPSFVATNTMFSFGSSTHSDKSNTGAQSSPFKFGTPTVGAASPSFGSDTLNNSGSTLPSSGFGNQPVSNTFGSSTNTTSFVVPTTSATGFGAPVAKSISSGGFGTPATTSISSGGFGAPVTSVQSGGFGTSTTASNISFGANAGSLFNGNQASPFGPSPPTTTASGFGGSVPSTTPFATNNLTFGATTQVPFGNTSTTVSFNTTVTTSSATFGSKPNISFGTSGGFESQTNNMFASTATTQSSGFGMPNTPSVFGQAKSALPFGSNAATTSAPSFGNSSTPAFTFGAKTTNSTFGGNSSFATATGNSSGFANAPTASFGTNSFGSTNPPSFGTTTTTQNNSFGTSNTQSFGTAGEGFVTSKPIFGNATAPSFGTISNTPTFGTTSTAPAFGNASATPPFGTVPTGFGATGNSQAFGSNAFAKPQAPGTFPAAPNTFGATNTGFNTAPPVTQAPIFNFGSGSATAAKPGVFSFGGASGSGDPPKPTFNFTSGATAPPAFGGGGGTSSTSTFPNNPAPAFGAVGTAQFGTPQPTGPVFNIGTGPPASGRGRTHLRAKRRT